MLVRMVSLALLVCPLCAQEQEVSLLVTRSATHETSSKGGEAPIWWRSCQVTGLGLQYERSLLQLGGADLVGMLAYHARTSADVVIWQANNFSDLSFLKQEGGSAGVQYQWQWGLRFGLGAEVRLEQLTMSGFRVRQVRPWMAASIAYAMAGTGWHPVFGLNYAYALTGSSLSGGTVDTYNNRVPTMADTLKQAAPNQELSLSAGVRF